jgi:hypothetical protein
LPGAVANERGRLRLLPRSNDFMPGSKHHTNLADETQQRIDTSTESWRHRPPLAFGDISRWQIERASLLQRGCVSVERRAMNHGCTERAAIARLARTFRARHYRSVPSRRIRLSGGRLATLFYRWKRSGRTPAAFALHYRCVNQSGLPARFTKEFFRFCFRPEVTSMLAAFRQLAAEWRKKQKAKRCRFPHSYYQFRRALGPRTCKRIRAFHLKRPVWRREERRFGQQLARAK